jgi:hypothetical protein
MEPPEKPGRFIRLIGICPPAALRPLLQDGHVVGTYEVAADYADKGDLDFSRRLIAKFGLPKGPEFRREVAGLSQEELFPSDDPLLRIAEEVRLALREVEAASPSEYGYFLEAWTKLERLLLDTARFFRKDVRSVSRAAAALRAEGLPEDTYGRLLRATEVRNQLVHSPQLVKRDTLLWARSEVETLTEWADAFYRETAKRLQ